MTFWHSTIDRLFVQPEQLVWIWLVFGAACAIAVGEMLRLRWRRRLVRLSGGEPTRRSPNVASWLAAAVRLLTLALIAFALADPRAGLGAVQVRQSQLQLVFAIDRSRSMRAEDVQSSRLEVAKRVVVDTVEEAGGAAVALATFAGDARIDVPLTRDYLGFRDRLESVRPESNAVAGTNLGLGMETAASCFADRIEGPKVLIVITDGETHGVEPDVGDVRLPEGTRLLVLGVGDAEQGARIPIDSTDAEVDADNSTDPRYLTYDGEVVWSKADPQRLRQLAGRLGGTFARIGSGRASSTIRETLQEVESSGTADANRLFRRQLQPRFHWLLLGALLLLALEMVFPWKSERGVVAATRQAMVLCVLSLGAASSVSAAEPSQSAADSPPTVRRLGQLYNEGVRSYRAARWRQADAHFRTVARHAEGTLQSKAMFNRASAQYQLVNDGGISRDQAIQQLQNGIEMLRRCIARGHRVEDARANIEILYRRLRQIEQQPPSGQGEGESSQNESSQDDRDRPEEESDGDDGDRRPPPSNPEGDDRNRRPDQGDEQGSGDSPDDSDDPQRPPPNRPPPPDDGDANGQSGAPGAGTDGSDGGESAEVRRRPLSEEEAEQQLRRIRQRSRQQREQDEQPGNEAASVSPPVGLPW